MDERSHICVVPHPLRLCGRRYQHRPTLLCRRNDKCMSKRGRRAIPFARSVCVSCLNHGRRHALAGDLDRHCDKLRVLCEMACGQATDTGDGRISTEIARSEPKPCGG